MSPLTLSDQRDIVLRYIPTALKEAERVLHSHELSKMIASRLSTGDEVFGDKMFHLPPMELHHEFVEELADALLYLCAKLYTVHVGFGAQ